MSVRKLRHEKGKIWEQMNALDEAVKKESREWAATDQETWDKLSGQLDAKINEIAREEVREKMEADRAASATEGETRTKDLGEQSNEIPEDEKELRAFLNGEKRSLAFSFGHRDVEDLQGGRERRDLTKLSSGAGGYSVPTGFVRRLYEHMVENSAIRRSNATVLTTATGEALQIPKTTGHGAAALVAEAGPLAESDPVLGQVTLDAYKYGQLIQVSSELVTDTAVDLTGYLARQAGVNLGNASGAHFVSGDGSGKPNGIVGASTLGKTAAGAAAVTADELIDLYFSVIEAYRRVSTWMMKDATMASIRKLKDSTNQYLWQPGLVAGVPDQILGRPVFTDPNMPAMTTGLKSIIFGDFAAYYIRDVGSVRFERSDDYAFGNDLITFRAIIRTDGDLVDTSGAVKHLIQA